ncbi:MULTISPECIES: Tn3 family transposase [unclassified Streptomyces]|uniref:Tn3 family transposase n=1 Tax=unclassified Streptomyces TaxID=2593676 RepID=UPI002E2CCE91|nr:Tn3 family transposase [Streptomyces sp. NBC_00228]
MLGAEERQEVSAGYPSFVHGIRESDWPHLRLGEEDMRLIQGKRGEHNRLGMGVQLTVLRFLGRFQTDMERIPEDLVLRVGEQLGISDPLAKISVYGENGDTVRNHAREIRQEHGWTSFAEGETQLVAWLEERLKYSTDGPKAMTLQAVVWLREQRVLLPTHSTLRDVVTHCRAGVEDAMFKALVSKMSLRQVGIIDWLMEVPADKRTSRLDSLRRDVGEPSWDNFAKALSRADEIRALGFVDVDVSSIPDRKLAQLADHALTERVPRLREQTGRRAAVLAAIKRLETSALDDAIDMLDKLITERFIAKPKRWADKALVDAYPKFAPDGTLTAQALLAVLESVAESVDHDSGEITDPVTDTSTIRAVLETIAERNTLVLAAKNLLEYMPARDSDTHEARRAKALERFQDVQTLVPVLIDRVRFGASPAGRTALAALHALPPLLDREDVQLDDIDTTLVKGSWKPLVEGDPEQSDGAVNVPAYALCVVETFHRHLCKREIFVQGCARWGNLLARLLSGEVWAQEKPSLLTSLDLPEFPSTYLDLAASSLHADLAAVASRMPEGAQLTHNNGDLALPKGRPPRASSLSRQVQKMLPRVELPQVVLDVLSRTGAIAAFTTRNGNPSPYPEFELSVAAVMVGYGCNIGLEAVANDEKDALKLDRLTSISREYFRPDVIEACTTAMLGAETDALNTLHLDGERLASVDGHSFVIPTPQTGLHIAPEGNSEVTWLTMLTEQAIQLSGRMVSGQPSAALEALNTLTTYRDLTSVRDSRHPEAIVAEAGTHEDLVFGLLTLSGYSYQPTSDQTNDPRLWRIDKSADYGPLQGATRRQIDVSQIAAHWEDILRVIGSIHHGAVSAHDALRILTRNGQPTHLGSAIASVGRIAKTRHLLRLYDNPEYRSGIEAQSRLHKERSDLARRICHGIDGPFPNYYPGLENRLGVLGLVLNTVALFNTVYIQKIVEKMRAQGKDISQSDLRQLSRMMYSHINMRGRFHFEPPTDTMFEIPDLEPDPS